MMMDTDAYRAYWLEDQTWLFEDLEYEDVLVTWRNILTGQFSAELFTVRDSDELENKIEKAAYAAIGTLVNGKFMIWMHDGDDNV